MRQLRHSPPAALFVRPRRPRGAAARRDCQTHLAGVRRGRTLATGFRGAFGSWPRLRAVRCARRWLASAQVVDSMSDPGWRQRGRR